MHALVLNATYEPLGVVPDRRALVLVLTGKAVSVADSGQLMRSVTVELAAPAVVRLARYVRVPHHAMVPLTRRAVFVRDGGRCAYCGAPATSIDHVVPRSRGGEHAWDNVVAACQHCNHRKGDRTLAELGWELGRTPAAPSGLAWRVLGRGGVDPRWEPFLLGHPPLSGATAGVGGIGGIVGGRTAGRPVPADDAGSDAEAASA